MGHEYVVACQKNGAWVNRLAVVQGKEDILQEARRVHGLPDDEYEIQWLYEKYGLYITATTLEELPDGGQLRIVEKSPVSRPADQK